MRKLALLLLCLASCFVTVFAQGGGGGGGPVPTANFRITGVQMDQPRAFVVGDTTTQFANATAYDYDTGEPIPITGFVGFAPMSSDSLTVRINWFNPFTGEVNYSVLQPGTARIFFVSDQPDSRGKLPPDWRGVFITGIQPAEHDSYARSEVLVYPDEDSFVPGDSSVKINLHYYGQGKVIPSVVYMGFTDPIGQYSQTTYGIGPSMLQNGNRNFAFLSLSARNRMWGRYRYLAVVIDNTGRIIGQNKFEITFGEYSFPGRPGGSLLDYAYLSTDYRNRPFYLQLNGLFPGRFSDRDVRVLINGELVSEAGTRSFVDGYDTYNVSVNVLGLRFPPAQYDLTLFFLSTGLVIHKKAGLTIDVNPEDYMNINYGGCAGGCGSSSEKSSTIDEPAMKKEIIAKVTEMFKRLGLRR
ncbi:MAG: hypothetical protein A3I32_01540 [Candidatus Yanofskybacteria bacterium RIFCSPLOWO2_02_FULL_45_10]|uniref:Uncharacterized protein n=1 Tax=Candidatus Yanofskybacteria bacterium RIFCSPLOWO2_02_FULL_45_10 TaxID=1802706 RepID=A0A1F8H7X6_9BACT|nr:MAG: hypothetical protein A3I32_01540 [Candidatus Yanofskybacteria bacterium RIFCSPLOWO2_02_FULL_45_10]